MKRNPQWFANVEDRAHPWPGLNWLTTGLIVPDVEKALAFYTESMEMASIAELPDDNDHLLFARVRYRGINFTLNKEGWYADLPSPRTASQAVPFLFYLCVDDVRRLVKQMQSAGATLLLAPEEMFWGDLRARLKDPFGYVWDVAEKLGSDARTF